EPARRLGAHGAYALRLRPALFARPAHGIAARDQLHARRQCRGAVLSALQAARRAEAAQRLRTAGAHAVADVLRRHYRGSAEAALPGPARCRPSLAPRLRARAGAAGRADDARGYVALIPSTNAGTVARAKRQKRGDGHD